MLGLLLFVAGSMTSCDPTDIKRCVDREDCVVEDEKCLDAPLTSGYHTHPYHWYYGGSGFYGEKATGGYTHPASGVSYSTGTSKGGFGHSAGLHGGGFGGHGGSAAA